MTWIISFALFAFAHAEDRIIGTAYGPMNVTKLEAELTKQLNQPVKIWDISLNWHPVKFVAQYVFKSYRVYTIDFFVGDTPLKRDLALLGRKGGEVALFMKDYQAPEKEIYHVPFVAVDLPPSFYPSEY